LRFLGDEQIASLADSAPFKAERLIGALEAFIAGGPSTLIAREPRDDLAAPSLELRLIPPRQILHAFRTPWPSFLSCIGAHSGAGSRRQRACRYG
jgi:hypothetical protein